MANGLCSQCRWENDNPLQSNSFTVPPTPINPLEEKLDTIINQLDTIADVLYEMRNRK